MVLPEGTVIMARGYLVLSPDPERTSRRYGVPRKEIVGAWAGRLDNDGDSLELLDGGGRRIARTRYRDGAGWPAEPDGQYSLLVDGRCAAGDGESADGVLEIEPASAILHRVAGGQGPTCLPVTPTQ